MREAVTFPYSHKHGDVLTVSTGYGSSWPLTHLLEYGNSKGGILTPCKNPPLRLTPEGFCFYRKIYGVVVAGVTGVVVTDPPPPSGVVDVEPPAPTIQIFGKGR